MIAYKAFGPGLVCRNYQFEKGRNVTDKAKCAAGGFHCAEDPLDCLYYYQWNGKNEFWIVEAGGDIDEDGVDTRISCTELTTLAKLDEERYLMAAVAYMMQHPERTRNKVVDQGPFHVCRDKEPRATGKMNSWILLAREEMGEVREYVIAQVDGVKVRAGHEYGMSELREAVQA